MTTTHTNGEDWGLISDGDLNERQRSEAALRRLATVLQDSNDAITMQDLGGSVALNVQSDVVGHWDRLRIEQVLANLLTNAVKYGGRTPIDISVEADATTATIVVRDRGPGIPESEQERIFQQFIRTAPKGTGGLGLGLYITRQIVEAHGGTIRVESRPGAGAAFFVTLPLRRQEG